MSRDTLPAALVESLIFWTEDDLPEDFSDEITREDDQAASNGVNLNQDETDGATSSTSSKEKGKGIERADEKRQSMYVGLFEGGYYHNTN